LRTILGCIRSFEPVSQIIFYVTLSLFKCHTEWQCHLSVTFVKLRQAQLDNSALQLLAFETASK